MYVHVYLQNHEKLPYAFYIKDYEIETTLADLLQFLLQKKVLANIEEKIIIEYSPLSLFNVRPVTRQAESMRGHTDAVTYVQFSPDGKGLASGGGDMAIRFWNTSSLTPFHTCKGHRDHILAIAWSPDGSVLVAADKSGEIRVWDPLSGKQRGATMSGHRKYVTALCFEPYHININCIRLASASRDVTVKVWNIVTGICETTISGHSDSIEALRWGGNGLIYTASRDRTIKVWAIDGHGKSQQKLVRTLNGHAHRINTLALNCDYILRTGPFQLGDNGNTLSSMSTAEKQKRALDRYTAMCGTNNEILVSGSDDFTMFMWTPQKGKTSMERMTGHQALIFHIAFSPDGRYLASASLDKKVKLWNGTTGKFITVFHGHVGSVYQVSWSADSNYFVSASKDSTIKLWSPKNKKKAEGTLPGHEDEVYALDWSPDGTQVASGSKDRTVKVWHN